MPYRVFVTRKIPDQGIRLLKEAGCKVTVSTKNGVLSPAELRRHAKNADALLSLLTDKIDADFIGDNMHLKVIANYAVGFDNIDLKAATAARIPVSNTPGVPTDAVAEHTFALMLALARRIPESDSFTRAGKYHGWQPELLLGMELQGKTLGIVGLGRIGFGVAQRAVKGMGMTVVYTDIKRNLEFEQQFGGVFMSLEELLKTADVVSIHVPLLPTTRHLISTKQLSMMKKSAFLINTSRGPVVDEKALVAALKKKRIAGAGLDVYEFEPKLVAGLVKLQNTVLTPHTASATIEARQAMGLLAAKNILAVMVGQTPPTVLNPEVLKR